MSLLGRITTTINATMDNVVSRVEDHDAIIDASIQECRQAAARTRARLSRVQRDGSQLRTRHDRLLSDVVLWTERAVNNAETDEDVALKCLKCKKSAETEIVKIEQTISEHSSVESKLQTQLGQIEARIAEISHKRNTMRSRQSLTEAMRIMDKLDGDASNTVDDTFERWETVLLEREPLTCREHSIDSFEMQFIDREELESLQEELKTLSSQVQEDKDE